METSAPKLGHREPYIMLQAQIIKNYLHCQICLFVTGIALVEREFVSFCVKSSTQSRTVMVKCQGSQ